MELKTREDKLEAIRNVINNDSYTDMLSQEEVDELFETIKEQFEERYTPVRETIERIFKTIGR